MTGRTLSDYTGYLYIYCRRVGSLRARGESIHSSLAVAELAASFNLQQIDEIDLTLPHPPRPPRPPHPPVTVAVLLSRTNFFPNLS